MVTWMLYAYLRMLMQPESDMSVLMHDINFQKHYKSHSSAMSTKI